MPTTTEHAWETLTYQELLRQKAAGGHPLFILTSRASEESLRKVAKRAERAGVIAPGEWTVHVASHLASLIANPTPVEESAPTPPPFDKPRSRAENPATSKAAGEENVRERNSAQQAYVLGVVRACPGDTAREYDDANPAAGLFRRRLPELAARGYVRKDEARPCRVGKRMAATWWPVDGGES